MNEFYGFKFDFDNGNLSDSSTISDVAISTIPHDRYSVGDVPMVVKCAECDEYMVLNDREDGNTMVGEFVCPKCGQSISQFDVFAKMSDEVRAN